MSFERSEWTTHDPRVARVFDPPPRPYPWHEQLRNELFSVTPLAWLSVIYLLYRGYADHDLSNGAIGLFVGGFLCVQPFRIRRVLRHGELVAATIYPSDLGSIYFWVARVDIGGRIVKVPLPASVRDLVRREGSVEILVLTQRDRPGLSFFVAHRRRLRA